MMVALPDDEFFAIMRNYLGKLQTPFNKHSLIDSLANFLLREGTEERVLSMIDKEDALLLTSINFLSGTNLHELHDFLGNERSFMSIHHLLLNLEERLLIYRDAESGRIRISPVFEELFKSKVFDTDLLFPSMDCPNGKYPDIWFTDALVIAFISFLYKTPDILKLDGTIKKKASDEIRRIFPDLSTPEKTGTRLDILLQALQDLSIINQNPDEIVLLEDNLLEFSELNIKQRYMLYTAASAGNGNPINLTIKLSELIDRLINTIPENKSFTLKSIKKLLLLIIKKSSVDYLNPDSILDSLISLKFLVFSGKRYVVNPHLKSHLSLKGNAEPPLIVQPSFDITVKPWISLKDGVKFAGVTEIKKFDLYPDFELNRSSYTRGHDCKLHSGNIIEILKKLSERPVPQNISVSVESWEEDYNRVHLYEGIILTVNSDKRMIIEHLQKLHPYILRELADGIYLMDSENVKEWRIIIENAGINVPGIQKNTSVSESTAIFHKMEILKESDILRIPTISPVSFVETSDFRNELNIKLDSLKLSPQEQDGFKVRIDKKLILYPDQIQKGNIRNEKTEASGMDYIGKVRLIERTLESKNELLEVTFGSPIEKLTTYLVKPVDFDKSQEDLLLNAISLPEEKNIQLIVRKMSKVKRLKSSLFAPPKETVDL